MMVYWLFLLLVLFCGGLFWELRKIERLARGAIEYQIANSSAIFQLGCSLKAILKGFSKEDIEKIDGFYKQIVEEEST